jgi:hypothetical protein
VDGEACLDAGPWACLEEGCPQSQVGCDHLHPACKARFDSIWSGALPDEALTGRTIAELCRKTCGACKPPAPPLMAEAVAHQSFLEVWEDVLPPPLLSLAQDRHAAFMKSRKPRADRSHAWIDAVNTCPYLRDV